MKEWSFQVKNSPIEISKQLKSSLESAKRFAFDMNENKDNRINFKLRKRLLLPFQINTQNNIIVNGKISKTNSGNKTDVEVSFSQHPLSRLLMYGHIILGLGFIVAIISDYSNSIYTYLIAGILIVIGILGIFDLKKSFDKNVQEYKKLITEILDQNLKFSK